MRIHFTTLADFASEACIVLDLGCDRGDGSTYALATGLNESPKEGKLLISVDIIDNLYVIPPLAYWKFVLGDTRKSMTVKDIEKITQGRKADLIFIDTTHTYKHLKKELENFKRMAHKKTVWLFHDTYFKGRYNQMTDAIKEFCPPTHRYKDISKESHGLGALLPK